MNFTIDHSFITSVTIQKEWSIVDHVPPEQLTHEHLIKILKGQGRWSSTSTVDHPEFQKLRDQLEELGYIKTERSWWNGDIVLKTFNLNGRKFRKGQQFPCAAALGPMIKNHI